MSFSKLPAELLLQVAACSSEQAHAALARTSRFAYCVLNRQLYRRNDEIFRHREKVFLHDVYLCGQAAQYYHNASRLWKRLERARSRHSLSWAVRRNRLGTIKAAAHMGIEIRRAFVLEMAARKGRTEIVEFILKDVDNIGSHMDHQDLSRDTGYFRPCEPLHAAAIGGKRTIARLLLARGADVNAISAEDHKKTPLHCAVESGNLRFISLLLASGANTTTQDAMGHTALHTAARREGAQAMELLLENGAAVHAHNDTARTPMYTAIQFNNEKCVKALLKHGATLPRHHAPALFVALSLSSFKAARAILEHFPNLPIVQRFANGRKSHALTTATSKLELFGSAVDAGNLIEVVKILVDRGADISAVDFLGRTALHHACAAACGDIAYLLVSKGANIHAEDRNRVTPFDIAVKYHVDNRSVRGSMTVNEMFKFERHTD